MGNINTIALCSGEIIALAIGGGVGVVVIIILGFVIYKYTKKNSIEKDDDKTSYDEDRALVNKDRGLVKAYI